MANSSRLLKNLYANKAEFNRLKVNDLHIDDKNSVLSNSQINYNSLSSLKKNELILIHESELYYHYKLEIDDIDNEYNSIFESTIIDLLGPISSIEKTSVFFKEIFDGFSKYGRNFDIDSIDRKDLPKKINDIQLQEEKTNYNITLQYIDNNDNLKKMIYLTLLSISKVNNNGYKLGLY